MKKNLSVYVIEKESSNDVEASYEMYVIETGDALSELLNQKVICTYSLSEEVTENDVELLIDTFNFATIKDQIKYIDRIIEQFGGTKVVEEKKFTLGDNQKN